MERLDLSGHELVISSSSAFAHGVQVSDDAVHICYCHSPFRYAWHERERGLHEVSPMMRPLLATTLNRTRHWDVKAARRVTHYLTNSELSRRRIQDYWQRDAMVVHPPVEVERFRPGTPDDYLLVVSEIVPHKRIDVALEAAHRVGRRIMVVGTGPDLPRLQARFSHRTSFLGRIDDDRLAGLYAGAQAVIVPSVEEFGIVAVEAQAAGRPVVAAGSGGALETVIDGETGVLVPPGDPTALAEALRETDFERFDPQRLQAHAKSFSADAFRQRLRGAVNMLTGHVRAPVAAPAVPSAAAP
jgi:glycosyltransferase involved in cell wall biosynthesis